MIRFEHRAAVATFFLLCFLCVSDAAHARLYATGMGRFSGRDPLGQNLVPDPTRSVAPSVGLYTFAHAAPAGDSAPVIPAAPSGSGGQEPGLSLYAYVMNQPVNRTDPYGLEWEIDPPEIDQKIPTYHWVPPTASTGGGNAVNLPPTECDVYWFQGGATGVGQAESMINPFRKRRNAHYWVEIRTSKGNRRFNLGNTGGWKDNETFSDWRTIGTVKRAKSGMIQFGPKAGKDPDGKCECVTCDDIKECMRRAAQASGPYRDLAHNCFHFGNDILKQCCLEHDDKYAVKHPNPAHSFGGGTEPYPPPSPTNPVTSGSQQIAPPTVGP